MLIPDGSSVYEFTVKKSRFISEIVPIESPEAARMVLKAKKAEHPDAAHVVHAFIAGSERQFMGMSDDGEPSGTSGKPVLEILKGRGITDIMLTVVRYFGGTKLGTGGLVRAYSEAASGALDALKTRELVSLREFALSVDYHFYQPLKSLMEDSGCLISEERFDTQAHINGQLPESRMEEIREGLTEAASGRLEFRVF